MHHNGIRDMSTATVKLCAKLGAPALSNFILPNSIYGVASASCMRQNAMLLLVLLYVIQ